MPDKEARDETVFVSGGCNAHAYIDLDPLMEVGFLIVQFQGEESGSGRKSFGRLYYL